VVAPTDDRARLRPLPAHPCSRHTGAAAIRADVGDLDPDRNLLWLRHGKFDKPGQLPLHPTTMSPRVIGGVQELVAEPASLTEYAGGAAV